MLWYCFRVNCFYFLYYTILDPAACMTVSDILKWDSKRKVNRTIGLRGCPASSVQCLKSEKWTWNPMFVLDASNHCLVLFGWLAWVNPGSQLKNTFNTSLRAATANLSQARPNILPQIFFNCCLTDCIKTQNQGPGLGGPCQQWRPYL